MNNKALKALFDEVGDRVCVITFDNQYRAFVGYAGSTAKTVKDITLKTIGGVDFVGIPVKSTYSGDRAKGVTATVWHTTETIQAVTVMDEGYEDYRMDPLTFQ